MKNQDLYSKLVVKMAEISSLPTQKVGIFTPLYKKFTSILKDNPWKTLFLFSLMLSFFLRFLLGPGSVKIVSILQGGF